MASDESSAPLHVFDLPQIYQHPSAAALELALSKLVVEVSSFGSAETENKAFCQQINPQGVTRYLTSIIASSLDWIEDEQERERLWELAGRRLSERSGRTAMGNMTRIFSIPRGSEDIEPVHVKLHEPALTEDNLGLKTWSSSFVLARKLHLYDLPCISRPATCRSIPRILELGSGTGLLGIAAAAIWRNHVLLTDLPEIVSNLQKNISMNADMLDKNSGSAQCEALDWTLEPDDDSVERSIDEVQRATVVLVADPIYSTEHPKLLVNAIRARILRDENARVVLGYPVRDAYTEQIAELRRLLSALGLVVVEEATESSQDDWEDEVTCSCSVWRWSEKSLQHNSNCVDVYEE